MLTSQNAINKISRNSRVFECIVTSLTHYNGLDNHKEKYSVKEETQLLTAE